MALTELIKDTHNQISDLLEICNKHRNLRIKICVFCLIFSNLLTLKRFGFKHHESFVNQNYFIFSQLEPLLVLY